MTEEEFVTFTLPPSLYRKENSNVSVRKESIRAVEEYRREEGGYESGNTCLLWIDGLHDQIEVKGTRKEVLRLLYTAEAER
jgi:hypothetical protein